MPKFNLGWLKDKNGEKFAPKTFLSQILQSDGSLFQEKVESIENRLDEHDKKIINNEVITDHENCITQNTTNITNNTNNITSLSERVTQNENNTNTNTNSITDLETRVTNHEKRYAQTQFVLTDTVNGYDYIVEMQGGNLVSFCICTGIEITTLPDITTYIEGASFDPTGMVVSAVCQDGSTREISNYTYDEYVTGNTVTIKYTECGNEYTTTIEVIMTSVEDALVDFTYTANDDGTYTITGWNQTLNDESSTEMVVPDSNLIIM